MCIHNLNVLKIAQIMTPSAFLPSLYGLISTVCLFTVNDVGGGYLYLCNFRTLSENIKK